MKKLASIALILVLTLPFWVFYAVLKIQIYQVRKEVKHEIIDDVDREDLVQLSFTKIEAYRDLEWEHSKEFEYRGEMYDIVEAVETQDSVYYWCWWDQEETQLSKKLQVLLGERMHKDPFHQDQKRQFYSFLDHLFTLRNDALAEPSYTIKQPLFVYSFGVKEFYNCIPSPPPRHFS